MADTYGLDIKNYMIKWSNKYEPAFILFCNRKVDPIYVSGKVMPYTDCFLAATKQLYEWFSPSVRPSVCLSVRHTFFIIMADTYGLDIKKVYD